MQKVDFYWWNAKDFGPLALEVMDKVLCHGAENVRIKLYPPDSTDEGRRGLFFVDVAGQPVAELHEAGHNVIHTCPPDCPNGD